MKISRLQRFKWWCREVWNGQPPLSPVQWQTSSQLIRSNFRDALSDEETAKPFDTDFLKSLVSRRTERLAVFNKLFVFNLSLTGLMAAWLLIETPVTFSLLGLSIQRIDQLVEVVRLLASLAGGYAVFLGLENFQAKIVIEEIASRISAKAPAYLKLAYSAPAEGLVDLAPPQGATIFRTGFLQLVIKMWLAGTVLAMLLTITAAFAVNAVVVWSMLQTPAIGPFVSRGLAGLAILIDVTTFALLLLMYSPLPMRNYTDVMDLAPLLEKQGREVWLTEMNRRLALRKKRRKS